MSEPSKRKERLELVGVTIPAGWADELKACAKANGLKLQDMVGHAVDALLERRSQGRLPFERMYFASPLDAKRHNFLLAEQLYGRLTVVAEEDQATIPRIIFTALLYFREEQRLKRNFPFTTP